MYDSPESYECPWFQIEDDDQAARALHSTVLNLRTYQEDRISTMLKFFSIYANKDVLASASPDASPLFAKQINNKTQAIIDNICAKQIEAEVKATFQTEDGDFADHRCAEQIDKFVYGEFYRLKIFKKQAIARRDSCIVGPGYIKFYKKNKKVTAERVLPFEIILDEQACISSEPTEMYQSRYVPKQWAINNLLDKNAPDFEKHAAEIMQMASETPIFQWPGSETQMVQIVEGWHLSSDEHMSEPDGKHILAVGHVPLLVEPWKYTVFPFAVIEWSEAVIGAYAQGLADQLAPLQLELNKAMRRRAHSLHLLSVPRIWQAASCKVSPEYDNLIGNVYKYTGPKPEIEAAPSFNPELNTYIAEIKQDMDLLARVNPMQSGDMPSRFDSRPALREAQEIADQPHAWWSKSCEDFSMDCAKQIVRVSREIVEEHGSYKAFGRAKDFVETIDWADCDLEDNRFVMRPEATSLLPTTPTGKRLVVSDMVDKNMFDDKSEAWEMLAGMPDVDAITSRKLAPRRLTEKQIYSIVKKGVYAPPEDCQDPIYSKMFALQEQASLFLMKDVPESVISDLDQYMLDCDNLIKMANPPPAAPANPVAPMQPAPPPGAMNGIPAVPPGIPGTQPGPPVVGPGNIQPPVPAG